MLLLCVGQTGDRDCGRDGIPHHIGAQPPSAHDATGEITRTLHDLIAVLKKHGAVLSGKESGVEARLSNAGRVADAVRKVGVVVLVVFAAGGAYQIFIDRNTTDDEVDSRLEQHSETPHPVTEQRLDGIETDVRDIGSTLAVIGQHQEKASARGEYQFHFTQWQSEVIDCQRRKCRRYPKKPDRLKELEAKLITGR